MSQPTLLPIAAIKESPFNYRLTFAEEGLEELAGSMKAVGVLQPILVRPVIQTDLEYTHEAVFGHRRLRGAKLAGLTEVPVFIREMTDDQVKAAQLAENLQREDVHPIEEAQGFAALQRDHGVSIEQLMKDTGKSRTYIYNRLKLISLTDDVREACVKGHLGAEVATLVARLPAKLQGKALELVKHSEWCDATESRVSAPMPYRQARDQIANRLMIEIELAPWDLERNDLAGNGICATCPRRSINDPGLSTLGKDVCTDTACFSIKKAAHHAEQVDTFRAAGGTVIEGEAACNQGGITARFRTLRASCGRWADGHYVNRTYGEELELMRQAGEDLPEVVLVVDPKTGEGDEMVSHDDSLRIEEWAADQDKARALAKKRQAGVDTGAGAADDDDDDDTPDATPATPLTPEERIVQDHQAWLRVKRAIMFAAAGAERTTDDMRVIILHLAEMAEEVSDLVAEVMGWPQEDLPQSWGEHMGWIAARIGGMPATELGRLALLMALDNAPFHGDGTFSSRLELAKAYGVDVLQAGAEPAPEPAAPVAAPVAQVAKPPMTLPLNLDAPGPQTDNVKPTLKNPLFAGRVAASAPKYRNAATGETWTGRGLQPKWIQVALAAGKKLEDFDTSRPPVNEPPDDAGLAESDEEQREVNA
ncbi:MAG: ParB/RepB/Spo0J family partition protein [Rubrivivax sp.]|nr:MAG: ParB/RepB/Spo0J family partition protein [Rubrivivax sp.]